MDREGIVKRIEELAIPLLVSEGLELVDVELKKEGHGLVLRFTIDKEGGVNLDVCSRASGVLGDLLDREDILSQSYVLEVCSPGIERPLKKKEDFKRFVGSKIFARTKQKIDGGKSFTGLLKSASDESFMIEYDGKTLEIPYGDVSKARLVVDINF